MRDNNGILNENDAVSLPAEIGVQDGILTSRRIFPFRIRTLTKNILCCS